MVAVLHPTKGRRGWLQTWLRPFRLAAAATIMLLVLHWAGSRGTRHGPPSSQQPKSRVLIWQMQQPAELKLQGSVTETALQQQQPQLQTGLLLGPNQAESEPSPVADRAQTETQAQQTEVPPSQPSVEASLHQKLQQLKEQQAERQRQMLQTQRKVFKCLNESDGFDAEPATYADHKKKGDVAKLIPVRLWQSTKQPPQQVLTVVTGLSKQRLPMLEAQCRSWSGPLTAVLYEPTVASSLSKTQNDSQADQPQVSNMLAPSARADPESETPATREEGAAGRKLLGPSKQGGGQQAAKMDEEQALLLGQAHLRLTSRVAMVAGRVLLQQGGLHDATRVAETEQAIQDTFNSMELLGPKACSLSVLLVTEWVDASLQEHLPINSLRNQAVLLSQTPLVAMLDADMVVSKSLADSLLDPQDAEKVVELVRGQDTVGRRVVVLPAFETLPFKSSGNPTEDNLTNRVADFAQQADKAAIKGLMEAGLLGPFNRVVNAPGHAETDYKKWLGFPPDPSIEAVTYHIHPQHEKYEPWYIIDRQAALEYPYDEVFRGYGKNKIEHRLWLSSLGFEYLVHGSAFIVHRIHPESDAKLAWRSQLGGKGGPVNTLRLDQLLPSMKDQSYRPSLGNTTATCAAQAWQRHELWKQQQQQPQT